MDGFVFFPSNLTRRRIDVSLPVPPNPSFIRILRLAAANSLTSASISDRLDTRLICRFQLLHRILEGHGHEAL